MIRLFNRWEICTLFLTCVSVVETPHAQSMQSSVLARGIQSELSAAESASILELLTPVLAQLSTVEREINSLETSLKATRARDSRASLQFILDALSEAEERLSRPGRRQFSRSTGIEFTVEELAHGTIPGTFGWLEIHLGGIQGKTIPLEIRSHDGEVLHAAQAVKRGDKIRFEWSRVRFECRVGALHKKFLRLVKPGHNNLSLEIGLEPVDTVPENSAQSRSTTATGHVPGVSLITDSRPTAENHGYIGSTPLVAAIFDRTRDRTAYLRQSFEWLKSIPWNRDAASWWSTLLLTRPMLVELQHALEQIEYLHSRLLGEYSSTADLSLVKVHVQSVHPKFPVRVPGPNLEMDAFDIRLAETAAMYKTIRATVMDVAITGKHFASRTKYGKESPGRLREDLTIGSAIEFDNAPPDTLLAKPPWPSVGREEFQRGHVYWVCLSPSLAVKAIPREYGSSGSTRVYFMMSSG